MSWIKIGWGIKISEAIWSEDLGKKKKTEKNPLLIVPTKEARVISIENNIQEESWEKSCF